MLTHEIPRQVIGIVESFHVIRAKSFGDSASCLNKKKMFFVQEREREYWLHSYAQTPIEVLMTTANTISIGLVLEYTCVTYEIKWEGLHGQQHCTYQVI